MTITSPMFTLYCPFNSSLFLHRLSCISISVGVQRTPCNNTIMVQPLVIVVSFTRSIIQQHDKSKATPLPWVLSEFCSPHPSVMYRTLRAPAKIIIQKTRKKQAISSLAKRKNIMCMFVSCMPVLTQQAKSNKQLHQRMNSHNITRNVQHYAQINFPEMG